MILVAKEFRFAKWFIEQKPIYAILSKSVAFAILLSTFDVVEEVVVGKFKGKTIGESFPHIGDGSPRAFIFVIIILYFALIRYFSFREIGRVFGERELRSLF